jgi:hypothetical protein
VPCMHAATAYVLLLPHCCWEIGEEGLWFCGCTPSSPPVVWFLCCTPLVSPNIVLLSLCWSTVVVLWPVTGVLVLTLLGVVVVV